MKTGKEFGHNVRVSEKLILFVNNSQAMFFDHSGPGCCMAFCMLKGVG
jgi:hypothetical protein